MRPGFHFLGSYSQTHEHGHESISVLTFGFNI